MTETYEATGHIMTNLSWLGKLTEDVLEPDLPIIDPHHHLWDRLGPYYAEELLADLTSGHNVRASVFIQCRYGYRPDGPEALRPVGETEFVVGIAEDCAARRPDLNACAGIVAHANLLLGDDVVPVLEAHREAAAGRLRGIRHITASGGDAFSGAVPNSPLGIMYDDRFRQGFAHLAEAGLTYDAWLYHPQIPDFTDLARAYPGTLMILDHVGGPLGIGPYRGRGDAVFAEWKAAMTDLAGCDNVRIKLGGLGMDVNGFDMHLQPLPPGSGELARLWRPYIETAIELFGVERCMFESNFPVDKGCCSYPVVWNAFKRLASGASATEKARLFHDTAREVYRL
ncbi:amidohydrolase family protein [Pseudooceanicola sp. C21-150M6]|uniref:amidohydrolase family protein n=1 Tax=Pseudooceanicola sp. C21-150M6 TaxID=3434355 RepID=UPI003D7FF52F